MALAATALTALIALLHLYILVLEMFLWTRPAGRRAFGMTAEQAEATKTLAANQGLYNGFLVAGLFWSLMIADPIWQVRVAVFFLGCVIVAGLYGGFTVSKQIILKQALPAIIALLLVFFS